MQYDQFVKPQDHIDLKDKLACDSVTFKAVNFQHVYSCFVAGDTGTVSYYNAIL